MVVKRKTELSQLTEAIEKYNNSLTTVVKIKGVNRVEGIRQW